MRRLTYPSLSLSIRPLTYPSHSLSSLTYLSLGSLSHLPLTSTRSLTSTATATAISSHLDGETASSTRSSHLNLDGDGELFRSSHLNPILSPRRRALQKLQLISGIKPSSLSSETPGDASIAAGCPTQSPLFRPEGPVPAKAIVSRSPRRNWLVVGSHRRVRRRRMCCRPCRAAFSASVLLLLFLPFIVSLCLVLWDPITVGRAAPRIKRSPDLPLRFRYDGIFKILQVADMHYSNGATTRCRDVLPSDSARCSDLNTTRFLRRLIQTERPDLIAFTGDNIFGSSATDAAESLFKAFIPVMLMFFWSSRIRMMLGGHVFEAE